MISLKNLELDNKKIFLIIPVFLIIIYLDFTFLIKSQLGNLRTQQPKIIKLKKDLDTLEKDLVKMQDLKNKQGQTNQKLLIKAKKIISEAEIPSVLQDISSTANKYDVNIVQIKPVRESSGTKPERVLPTQKFIPLLITLDLFCDYHSLGKFINDLENAPIFMAVENMRITAQTADYLKQKVNLVLRTYVRK